MWTSRTTKVYTAIMDYLFIQEHHMNKKHIIGGKWNFFTKFSRLIPVNIC